MVFHIVFTAYCRSNRADMAKLAKQNIMKYHSVVGVTEELTGFYTLLEYMHPHYFKGILQYQKRLGKYQGKYFSFCPISNFYFQIILHCSILSLTSMGIRRLCMRKFKYVYKGVLVTTANFPHYFKYGHLISRHCLLFIFHRKKECLAKQENMAGLGKEYFGEKTLG